MKSKSKLTLKSKKSMLRKKSKLKSRTTRLSTDPYSANLRRVLIAPLDPTASSMDLLLTSFSMMPMVLTIMEIS